MSSYRCFACGEAGLGRAAHEIPRRRETGDPPAGRAVPAAGAPHPGETRHSAGNLLPLVRPAQQRRARGAERSLASGAPLWNRIPEPVRQQILQLALDEPALSPRELAVRFTDMKSYFVSEASVYRLLKAHDLIASPAFIVIKAADAFKDKTTAPNQLWQTDFTYLKVIGWGWFYLSTVLDDFSRYIVAWKLCTTMRAEDVTATLDLALQASGLHRASPTQRPRLLSSLRRDKQDERTYCLSRECYPASHRCLIGMLQLPHAPGTEIPKSLSSIIEKTCFVVVNLWSCGRRPPPRQPKPQIHTVIISPNPPARPSLLVCRLITSTRAGPKNKTRAASRRHTLRRRWHVRSCPSGYTPGYSACNRSNNSRDVRHGFASNHSRSLFVTARTDRAGAASALPSASAP